jgi:NAD(P)-dependent dehydrogenase (short-subunit alcohol dehydrogenase family)
MLTKTRSHLYLRIVNDNCPSPSSHLFLHIIKDYYPLPLPSSNFVRPLINHRLSLIVRKMVSQFPSLTATWRTTTYPAIDPTLPHLSIKGKSILITGGGVGIGAKAAHSFAAASASIITITGRTSSTLELTKTSIESAFPNTKVLTAVGDVTDENAMDSAFAALSKANGGNGVDICIHNAGYLCDVEFIAKVDTSDWWAGFSTNILGSFVVTRAFLKHKPTSPTTEPIFVVVSTAAIALPPIPKYSGYAISKTAQSKFFEAVAAEETDVRFMQVHPGSIDTAMAKKGMKGGFKTPMEDSKLPFIHPSTSLSHYRSILCSETEANIHNPSSLPSRRFPRLVHQFRRSLPQRKTHLEPMGRGRAEGEEG